MNYSITLDLQKANIQCLLNMVRGDTDNTITVTFSNSGTADYLSGKTVIFSALKPDETFIYDNATIDGDSAVYTCDAQLCAVKGIVRCSFIVMEGTSIKASPQFFVVVNPNIDLNREIIESDNAMSSLNYLVANIQTKLNRGDFDGYSPTATVSKSGGTATITITDKNGTTSAAVTDGTNGAKGDRGDPGSAKVSAQVPVVQATGEPDVTSNAFITLRMGEMFYTNETSGTTHLFYLKVDSSSYLRVGYGSSEQLPIIPYTTDYQGHRVPNTNKKAFRLLLPGQMFLCETETETYKTWVKSGADGAYNYEAKIREITNSENKMDLIPVINDSPASVTLGQLFYYQSVLYYRTATGAIPITTGTEIPL